MHYFWCYSESVGKLCFHLKNYFMYMSILPSHIYVYQVCVSGTRGYQKRMSDSLGMELQTVVSCQEGAGV